MTVSRREFIATSTVAGASLILTPQVTGHTETPLSPSRFTDWEWVRSQFALDYRYKHFASFYIVSHPLPVRNAIAAWAKKIDENPFGIVEHNMFTTAEHNMQQRVCEAAAQYTGGRPEEFALVPNTTTGLALVYQGLKLNKGDEILMTTHDHYSHHISVRYAAQRHDARLRKIVLYENSARATADEILGRIKAGVRRETRVLGLTWVHSSTGVKLPIREIARVIADINSGRDPDEHILLIVDGVHGFGAVDEDVASMGCDIFVAGTHKWLFAPRGTGIIWARTEVWERLQPTIPTFSDNEPYDAWLENREPRGVPRSTWVTPGGFIAYEYQWAMPEAFHFHAQIGRKRVADRILELNGALRDGLDGMPNIRLHTPVDPALSAGLACFEVEGLSPEEVVHRYLDHKIIASTSPYNPTYPRLAAGIMNTMEEVEEVLRITRAFG